MRNLKQLMWPSLRSQVAMTAAAVTGLLFIAAPAARAQTPDPSDIAYGMELFLQKGNCQACHGWAGDGRKVDSQMPDGANLRTRALDREALLTTIKCGRPGTGMPAFDRLAYSDGRCFGLKAADLRARQLTVDGPARNPGAERNGADRRLSVGQGCQQGRAGPSQVRGILGQAG